MEVPACPAPKVIVRGFGTPQEFCDPPGLSDSVKTLATPGEHLVRVALVTHVEDQAIVGGIEDVVDRGEQFRRPEARSQMPPRLRDAIEDLLSNFAGHLFHAIRRQFP